MLVSGTAPILAPVLGAQLLRLTSWRGVLVTLTLPGLAILAATTALLTETLPAAQRRPGGLTTTLRTMRDLLRDRPFVGHLLTGSLGFAAMFAYIAGSSFTLQRIYGASPQTYSLLFALNSCSASRAPPWSSWSPSRTRGLAGSPSHSSHSSSWAPSRPRSPVSAVSPPPCPWPCRSSDWRWPRPAASSPCAARGGPPRIRWPAESADRAHFSSKPR